MEQSKEQTINRFVELWVLLRHLDALSYGSEQWLGLPLAPYFMTAWGEVQRYILVGYTNTGPSNLPNSLVYLIPIEKYQGSLDRHPKLLCTIGPDHIIPLSKGLYLLDDELKYNQQEDMNRFCQPLLEQLSLVVPSLIWDHAQTSESAEQRMRSQTLDGLTYRDALCALLTTWSESRQHIQNEIWTGTRPV